MASIARPSPAFGTRVGRAPAAAAQLPPVRLYAGHNQGANLTGPLTAPRAPKAPTALFHDEAVPPVDPHHPELDTLRARARWWRTSSAAAFWAQVGLSLTAAAVLGFGATASAQPGLTLPRALVGAALGCAALTAPFAWGFSRSARKLERGEVVTPSWISGNLLRCEAINVAGATTAVLGLQAAVGQLAVAPVVSAVRAWWGAAAAPGAAAAARLPLDVFVVQAACLVLLSHLVSLAYTNPTFSMVRHARYNSRNSLGSWDGVS